MRTNLVVRTQMHTYIFELRVVATDWTALDQAKQAGVHEVHYAMVVILAMGIGLFSPPFGVGYYGACAISRISPDEGLKHIWGYVAALFIGLVVVAAVPWLSTGFLKF